MNLTSEADRPTEAQRAQPVRRSRRVLDVEYEKELVKSFVRPSGWDAAIAVLRALRIVLLRGAEGCGRRTAAIRLLGEFGTGVRPIHELAPRRGDPESDFMDLDGVVTGDRLLLDLSAVDEDQLIDIEAGLLGFREVVRRRSAVLAVVLPTREERPLRRELRSNVARLSRPDGTLVFRAHLARLGLHDDYDEREFPQLARILSGDSMAGISRLASLVRESQERAGSSSLRAALGQALAAYLNRGEDVALQLAEHADGDTRALLLASAVLEGRPVDDVLAARRLLLTTMGLDPELVHEFERPPIDRRFRDIDARVSADGRVWFAKLRYAEAVTGYFWKSYPSLLDGFRNWVIECGCRIEEPRPAGEEFVRKYADLCLRARRPEDLCEAITTWAQRAPATASLALIALEYGLEDLREGWRFRWQCHLWATSPAPPPIAEAVVSACVDVIAPNFPNQAIATLHHLAAHGDGRVARLARTALGTLACELQIFRRLLARLTDPSCGRLDGPLDRELFLAAADPKLLTDVSRRGMPLIADATVQRQLVSGWHALLNNGPGSEVEAGIRLWLDGHAASQLDVFIVVLVKACRVRYESLAVLRAVGRQWLDERIGMSDFGRRCSTVQRLECHVSAVRAWHG